MCGICGIVVPAAVLDREITAPYLERLMGALLHRGPDSADETFLLSAALGTARLAIRGEADGRQPFTDDDGQLLVVCNGEIDNHRELREWLKARGRTVAQATDVAVIPQMYLELGDAFVERLVGAFALAIWDQRQRRLILARDRVGERPLFYKVENGVVSFASELSALAMEADLPADRENLQFYLRYGCFAAPRTPFAKKSKVAPGEIVTIDAAGVQHKKYWRWAIASTPKSPPSLEEFDKIFRNAVRRQSDVDVDFGFFLSGGVDSALVAAVARDLNPKRPLKAFTVRFAESSFDEGEPAEAVARLLNLDQVAVQVTAADCPREIESLVSLTGEPLADPAWIPTSMLARRAAQDVKLALVGEGGDELFGGYPTYLGARLAERFNRLPGWLRQIFKRAVAAVPPNEKKVSISFLLKRFLQSVELDGRERHQVWTSSIPPALLRRLKLPVAEIHSDAPARDCLLDRLQQHDFEVTLAEGLLTKSDRASMRSALELRSPFLDQAVIEFAARLPVDERVRGWQTKAFLKRYATRYLPRAIVYRRKRGLSVPLAGWLRGPLRDWAVSRLTSARLAEVGVDLTVVRELLEEHWQKREDHARPLWTLIVLAEWLEWVEKQRADNAAFRLTHQPVVG